MKRRGMWSVVLLLVLWASPAFAQRADVTGVVVDQTGAVLPGVTITVVNNDQGLKREAVTDAAGHFSLALLQPGGYVLTAQLQGFAPFEMKDLALHVGDVIALTIKMQVAKVGETVTVQGSASRSTASGSVGTVIDRQFVANIPLSGGTLQSLLTLTPGVVMSAGDGQMSVNGQRTDSNYLTIDGVSANIGVARGSGSVASLGTVAVPGSPETNAAGATPGFSAIGTTNSLFSIEELQEFKTETSNASAAFGRMAGGQIGITTRSGTNQYHGDGYDYYRNDRFDAADWFTVNAATPIPKQKLNQHLYGATLGGPVIKDRTFFFANYEGLRLTLPQTATLRLVPSAAMRTLPGLNTAIQRILLSYPVAQDETAGCSLRTMAISTTAWKALSAANQGGAVYSPTVPDGTVVGGCYTDAPSSRTTMDAYRIKIDQRINGSHTVWLRANAAPVSSQSFTLANRQFQDGDTYTVTAGHKAVLSAHTLNDLTVNWSRNTASARRDLIALDGSTPFDGATMLPSFAPAASVVVMSLPFSLASTSPNFGPTLGNVQEQWNITDNFRWVRGGHTLGAGIDYRRLKPVYQRAEYQVSYGFSTSQTTPAIRTALDLFTAANPLVGSLSTFANDTVGMRLTNVSAYVQDQWTVTPRLTLEGGVRWEINTPPTGTTGQLYTLKGFPDLSNLSLTTDPFFETKYNAFAPRISAAYKLNDEAGKETVLRGGYGLYYDLGMGAISAAGLMFPYTRTSTALRSVAYPSTDLTLAAPAALSLDPPYTSQSFSIMGPNYVLPRVQQWNATIERTLWTSNVVTVSYIGSAGRHLLRRYYYGFASTATPAANNLLPGNANFISARLNVTRNDAGYGDESDYQALQVSFFRRLTKGLQVLANYTLAKSTDTGSSSVNGALGTTTAATINMGQGGSSVVNDTRGYSDFDRRHVFNAAITYEAPNWTPSNGVLGALNQVLVKDWALDVIYKFQSAAPITPVYLYSDTPSGMTFYYRADQVAGQDVWLGDATAPGGKRLNPAAFAVPAGVGIGLGTVKHGNVERNSIRTFNLWQADLAIRRTFAISHGVRVQFRAEAFNVTNHENFSSPNPLLATVIGSTGAISYQSGFGKTTSMYNKGGNPGALGGGLNSLYTIGGPRSMQFTVKVLF